MLRFTENDKFFLIFFLIIIRFIWKIVKFQNAYCNTGQCKIIFSHSTFVQVLVYKYMDNLQQVNVTRITLKTRSKQTSITHRRTTLIFPSSPVVFHTLGHPGLQLQEFLVRLSLLPSPLWSPFLCDSCTLLSLLREKILSTVSIGKKRTTYERSDLLSFQSITLKHASNICSILHFTAHFTRVISIENSELRQRKRSSPVIYIYGTQS